MKEKGKRKERSEAAAGELAAPKLSFQVRDIPSYWWLCPWQSLGRHTDTGRPPPAL